jgi:hypothetical protein
MAGLALLGPPESHAETAVLSPESAAGFQTADHLMVSIALANPGSRQMQGTLQVEILGPDGQSVAEEQKTIRQKEASARYSFELPANKLPAGRLTLRCRFQKHQFEVPLSKVLLVKGHETSLSAGEELIAGSPAALHCNVHAVKSISETLPLAGAQVEVQLRDKAGQVFPLNTSKTGNDGLTQVEFKVPEVPSGQYTLVVASRSELGTEKLERQVQVRTAAKILLVTDKPLYQPGQLMHIRALTLRPIDLKPVAGSELTFEVEDAKGNKVFKRSQKTSDFGVAAIDFQLADEVNMGDFHIRATLGDHSADKAVAVKRYVLPKFKIDLKADKSFYLPKEMVHAQVQTDYFFGKPVAGAKIQVTASTFDFQFRQFQTWEGKTDAAGHATFDITLPDYFVGQPLQKGNALVRLEAKITDTADHTETVGKSYPVSDQPIRVSLIPEGGRMVPGMENLVFAAATYPDGSPAVCTVNLWLGREAKGDPFATLETNQAGLAEFRLTPKPEQFHVSNQWEQRPIEMVGGQKPMIFSPKNLLDLTAQAKDKKGNNARTTAEITSEPLGENILLRLDRAVYRTGDSLEIDVRSSAGLPTAYLDLVRSGQTLVTRWLDVEKGKASYRLDLPPELFGTLEIHAYQQLASGEIIRDSRVIYVQPRDGLKIDIKPDKDVYVPGAEGRIRFQVTTADGKPTAAALGVIVVDESVYALQDMQPGLEKVYFTLQEELLKPQAQAVYRPDTTIDNLVREPQLAEIQQQVAQVLLTSIKPKPPARWEVAPVFERKQKVETQVQQIGWSLFNYAANQHAYMEYDRAGKEWRFKPTLLEDAIQAKFLDPAQLKDPFDRPLTLESLARLENGFTVDHLAQAITHTRIQQMFWTFVNYTNPNQAKWFRNGKWDFPDHVFADALKASKLDENWTKDAWGTPIRFVKRAKKGTNRTGWTQFDDYELVSAGPDRKWNTADDDRDFNPNDAFAVNVWWTSDRSRLAQQVVHLGRRRMAGIGGGAGLVDREMLRARNLAANGFGLALADGAMAPAAAARGGPARPMALELTAKSAAGDDKAGAGSAPPTRVREYFPETMLWQPALITDDQGVAELPVSFADSITTWRLSASGSSKGGALGGVTTPLRVFQDFFVDLDLPVSLTQNDEVAFPVAVYNYLKTPQTVKLDLEQEPWFELTDGGGLSRSLDLKPNEVTSIKYRIRARRIGFYPLTVKATGSKMSDAIKRTIEIVPDGQKVELVAGDRLTGHVAESIDIPPHAIADASKLIVKIYPGVLSQVLEGTEGLLRLPGG